MKVFSFTEWLNESKNAQVHDAGCVMLFFEFPEMELLQKVISEKDIYTEPNDDSYGLENEPHCTILYGLDPEVELKDVKKIVKHYSYSPLLLHNASLFENEKYDVLKMDITYLGKDEEEEFLHDCNKELREKLPYESNFPNYHPHMTIAYLKPGKGKKYVKELKDNEYEVTPTHVVFSQPDGTKNKISVKIVKNDIIEDENV